MLENVAALIALAKSAGDEILKVRRAGTWTVTDKVELSPVTAADLAANAVLMPGLSFLTPSFPIVSEESNPHEVVRGVTYWLVDPLDGTRDFVRGLDTFVVSIGLISAGFPVFGIIHSPVLNQTWWAEKGQGCFRDGQRISNQSTRTSLIAAVGGSGDGSVSGPLSGSLSGSVSGAGKSPRLAEFVQKFGVTEVKRFGSALKFCRLAEGVIDVYPRFGQTSEWDTAAGQIIAEEANCKVLDRATGRRLSYGKAEQLNAHGFVAARADLELSGRAEPS